MLRPLLFLLTLSWLRGAVGDQSLVVLGSCQVNFYGKLSTTLFLDMFSDKFTMCFQGYYNSGRDQDCVVGPPLDNDGINHTFPGSLSSGDEAFFRTNLPNIVSNYSCRLQLTGNQVNIEIAKFESQTALKIQSKVPFVYNVMINGTPVETANITSSSDTQYIDISGCRDRGEAYKSDTAIWSFPENCTRRFCDSTANIIENHCGNLERCQGDHICVLDPTCTVTGPYVINFSDRTNSISDRCTYSLIRNSSFPGFQVLGNFQERLRKDVYFLDSVILYTEWSNTHIYLEQGSRARMNSTTLSLNSSAQLFEGVELSKIQAGVTAKLSHSGFTITIFFDDNMAQISLTGPTGHSPPPYVEGLCNDNTDTGSEKLLNKSPLNCETKYNDTGDTSDFCSDAFRRCSLLHNESFTACHSQTDPDPYYDACYNTLCGYPLVDSLDCQFMEAYARVCNPRINNTLEDWRPFADCPTPKAFCQERICKDHEFCAETISGETGCFCRGIFASPYRTKDTLGKPMVCKQTYASVTLVGCLLEEQGIDYSALQLRDENCHGQINEQDHTVTFIFNSTNTCGTMVTTNNSHMIFENTIMIQNKSIINRNDPVYINFSCVYPLPKPQPVSFKIKVNSVVKRITSGAWKYTLAMKAFTDKLLTQLVEANTEVQLDQKIWVELETDGLDGGFVAVVTDSCWATDKVSSTGSPRHDLIVSGCPSPSDQTVKTMGNGEGTSSSFCFNMFQFVRSSGDVYLHCKINLCAKHARGCIPNCNKGGRRRRSSRFQHVDEAAGFITMVWAQ